MPSLGWSLLPSTVIIVLAFVNSLLVGARVHHVRSDTGKCCVWPLTCTHHFQCVTYICFTTGVMLGYVASQLVKIVWIHNVINDSGSNDNMFHLLSQKASKKLL